MKPILKWEIDSIQAVIDEEKENLQGKGHKITVKIFTYEKPYITLATRGFPRWSEAKYFRVRESLTFILYMIPEC